MGLTSRPIVALSLTLFMAACGPVTPAIAPAGDVRAQARSGGFTYDPPKLPDVRPARRWQAGSGTMSGVEANRSANTAYQQLDGEVTRYLGAPELSSWLTFGKYASREVGGQIRSLESALEAVYTLKTVDFNLANDRAAIEALATMMRSDAMLDQSVRIALGIGKDADLCNELGWLCLRPPAPGSTSIREAIRRLATFLPVMRNALVEGNTEVYTRITTSYDTFLRAESRGENGVTALKAAVASGQVHDPLGYLVEAFVDYQQARQLSLRAAAAGGAERQQLLDQRRELVRRANLLLAVQEQGPILQGKAIFGDSRVAQLTGALSGRMFMTLQRTSSNNYQRFHMLPDGGNWAVYTDRMGFREVPSGTAGAFRVVLPESSTPHYYLPDATRRGTIFDLFEQGLDGAMGRAIRAGQPRQLAAGYTHDQDPSLFLASVDR